MPLFDILALISTLLFITVLRRLGNIFPSLVACMFRCKECVHFETSVKNYSDRDMIALVLVIPFCLVVEKYELYAPEFMNGMSENMKIAVVLGVFLVFWAIRTLMTLALRHKRRETKTYNTANKSAYSFFVILTLLLISVGSILSFFDIYAGDIRNVMLWISAFMYILYIFRKTQIFNSNCSIFTAFLYLCALEFLPTGLLIASVLVF